MPSPFPGMDPYLEDPTLWPDVHLRLINLIGESLLPGLRPAYFAQFEERVYVTTETETRRRVIVPDVSIVQMDTFELPWSSEGTGVATAPMPVMLEEEIEVHEARVEIRDAASREIVTVIEVLSPANKARNSSGFESYDQKRREVLHSSANFVEIDLLREGYRYNLPGRHVPATEYRVHVSKAHERPKGWVWPIRLVTPLPAIRIPLRKGDADVKLDLQKLLDTTYERAGYDLIVNYAQPLALPLSEAGQKWIEQILASKHAATR